MEIYVHDRDLIRKGVIDEMSSFIWTRRYWKPGDFKLLVPFTPVNARLLQKDALIMKSGDDEAGQIKYLNIRKNVYGMEEIEVQGRFISSWLDNRLVLNTVKATDNSQNILYRIVTENSTSPAAANRKIPMLEIEADRPELGSGVINYASEPLISALIAAESLMKGAKLGFKISADVRNYKYIFKIYKGRELTSDQQENTPCVFSQEFDNVYEQEYTDSTEYHKNVCYVGGEEREGEERTVAEVGEASGHDRMEVFVAANDIARRYTEGETEITIPLETYMQMLKDRGATELERYAESLNFSSTINSFSNLRYKTDYDIGDRVTCVNKAWGVKINVRITEIMETYQQTKNEIFVTFGESLPTLYDKLQ